MFGQSINLRLRFERPKNTAKGEDFWGFVLFKGSLFSDFWLPFLSDRLAFFFWAGSDAHSFVRTFGKQTVGSLRFRNRFHLCVKAVKGKNKDEHNGYTQTQTATQFGN